MNKTKAIKKKYKTLIDLPMYPAGTIVYHEYEILPSKYGVDRTYATDGRWFTVENEDETMVPLFLQSLIEWCTNSQRDDTKGYIKSIK